MKRLKDLFNDVKRKLDRKEEKQIDFPEDWNKQESVKNNGKDKLISKHITVKPKLSRFRKIKKIRLRFLKSTKRIIAFILFIFHGAATFLSFFNPIICLFFGVTAFILFDYLWKTKSVKVEFGLK